MHSTVYWQTEKPVSRPTKSRPEIVCIACVAIAAVVIVGAAYGFPLRGSPSELTFFCCSVVLRDNEGAQAARINLPCGISHSLWDSSNGVEHDESRLQSFDVAHCWHCGSICNFVAHNWHT